MLYASLYNLQTADPIELLYRTNERPRCACDAAIYFLQNTLFRISTNRATWIVGAPLGSEVPDFSWFCLLTRFISWREKRHWIRFTVRELSRSDFIIPPYKPIFQSPNNVTFFIWLCGISQFKYFYCGVSGFIYLWRKIEKKRLQRRGSSSELSNKRNFYLIVKLKLIPIYLPYFCTIKVMESFKET